MPLLNTFGGSSSRNYGAKLTKLFTVVNTDNATILSGQSYSATPLQASKGCGGFVYSVSPTLPTGLSLNTSTGLISGTPTQLKTATAYTITVRDRCGATAQQTFTLTVYSLTGASVSPAIGGDTNVDLTLVTLTSCGSWTVIPSGDFYANVKMWGGGGGASLDYPPGASGSLGIGGNGGYTKGNVQFLSGVTYQFTVGCGGGGYGGQNGGGGGGGASAIRIVSGSVPILVAGAGGGSGYSGTQTIYGGNGGGSTASGGSGSAGGGGGSQSAAGAGGVGSRRSGNPGSSTSGGGGTINGSGGGGGGTSAYGSGGGGGGAILTPPSNTDAGGGGGGGGYFGGGGGGGGSDGSGGGGGSSYSNPAYVSSAALFSGFGSDSDRGTSAGGGANGSAGSAGRIKMTTDPI